jgi:hypothetical protein
LLMSIESGVMLGCCSCSNGAVFRDKANTRKLFLANKWANSKPMPLLVPVMMMFFMW